MSILISLAISIAWIACVDFAGIVINMTSKDVSIASICDGQFLFDIFHISLGFSKSTVAIGLS
ncbi:12477_t:CDS:2 [Dentiscutata heterogama]|uniref:12477_t:CDS:1 n=1 Tax=Dentiscutata heterogama TaxID=1316150 RepID=A0ACA9KJL0_9GLOM|nr:12477_t:CDS:2 [Dentiscutata heterogama]